MSSVTGCVESRHKFCKTPSHFGASSPGLELNLTNASLPKEPCLPPGRVSLRTAGKSEPGNPLPGSDKEINNFLKTL